MWKYTRTVNIALSNSNQTRPSQKPIYKRDGHLQGQSAIESTSTNSCLRYLLTIPVFITLFVFLGIASAETLSPPFTLPSKRDLNRLQSAVLLTDYGEIVIRLFPSEAPWHVANLKYLSDKEFFKDGVFSIYRENYIIQGGNTYKKLKYALPPEFSERKHVAGIVGAARLPDELNPQRESDAQQFHIILGPSPHLDRKYTIFGKVMKGMDIARKLRKGDRIKDLIVFVRR